MINVSQSQNFDSNDFTTLTTADDPNFDDHLGFDEGPSSEPGQFDI